MINSNLGGDGKFFVGVRCGCHEEVAAGPGVDNGPLMYIGRINGHCLYEGRGGGRGNTCIVNVDI